MQRAPSRSIWLILGVLGIVLAAQLGGPVVTRVAYAVERGKIQADREELQQISGELAGVQAVSRAFHLVSNIVKPSVVHIRVAGGERSADEIDRLVDDFLRRRSQDLSEEELEEMFGEGVEPPAPDEREREGLRRLFRRPPPGSGSGVIFDSSGYILTNNHVVEQREEFEVTLHDDREFDATLIGTDPKTDLAVLRIKAPKLQALPFANSDRVKVGDWVLAVGSPFGLTQTVTHGIVSATGRTNIGGLSRIEYQDFIQTDASINPGNSGGPLVNLHGEIVGINTAIATNGDAVNAGVAFTIPSNRAQRISRELKDKGAVARGWLGIGLEEIVPSDVEKFGLTSRRGVLVDRVFDGMPAADAGLTVEDVIVSVDRKRARNISQFRGIVADFGPGRTVAIDLVRSGKPMRIDVRLGTQPDDIDAATRRAVERVTVEIPELGIEARTFRQRLRRAYDDNESGVLVLRARDWPDLDGFLLLTACNNESVKSITALREKLAQVRPGQTIKLRFKSAVGDHMTMSVERLP